MSYLDSSFFLDLSDEKGFLCGGILAALGANVLKVEKPGGDPCRLWGPFYKGVRHPERSLYWLPYNAGKRGITLDVEKDEGRELLKKLVKNADGVIETFPPGYLDRLGLGYQDLSRINPRIILTSITPFGQTGPYRDYRGSDIVAMAMGGLMAITGDPDRPPLRLYLDQSCCLASSFAAAGTLLAYYHCQLSGEGQHVDVSLYECVARMNYRETVRLEYGGLMLKRSGSLIVQGEFSSRSIWPCRDGYANWVFFGGQAGARENRTLVQWMDEEGMAGDLTRVNWEEVDTTKLTLKQWNQWEEQIAQFFLRNSKQELMQGALERGLMVVPLCGIDEVWKSEHLSSRNIWIELEHPELESTITYPGRLFLSTEGEAKVKGRAPLVGEHNREVYSEESELMRGGMDTSKRSGVITEEALRRQALEGVKVLDFSWVLAGPFATQILADFGAQVIKVESRKHLDLVRVSQPYKDGLVDPDRAGAFIQLNTSKYSITLDISHPQGREIAKRLVAWADVVVENFRPGTMDRLGLGYDDLRTIKPDIIMVSASILGQRAAAQGFAGYGTTGGSLTALYTLTGWPDRDPTAPASGALSDVAESLLAVSATISALVYRRRKGKGQHIDLSQMEPMALYMAPALLDYEVNGDLAARQGNRHDNAAPHGAFRCQGDDKWCVIAVFTAEQWQRLCLIMDEPSWTKDAKFATLEARKANEDELERLVEEWTTRHTPEEIMLKLQREGIPAGVVQNAEGIERCPHLREREFLLPLAHPVIGVCYHPSPPPKLSRTPARVRTAPLLGEHNEYVYSTILGMSDEEFVRLLANGVFH